MDEAMLQASDSSFLQATVEGAGPFLLPGLALAALLEYVFPPFPGDTVTLLGAYLAVTGRTSAPMVFLSVTAGSIVGSLASYRLGTWVRGRVLSGRAGGFLGRLLAPPVLARMEVQYRRWGPWLILANRFVPVTRSAFFLFAGVSALPLSRVVLLGAVSAALWNALLLSVGYAVGANLGALEAFVAGYNRVALLLMGAAVLAGAAAGLWWWRRRRAAAPAPVAESRAA